MRPGFALVTWNSYRRKGEVLHKEMYSDLFMYSNSRIGSDLIFLGIESQVEVSTVRILNGDTAALVSLYPTSTDLALLCFLRSRHKILLTLLLRDILSEV
jgi:hypothetical protein